MLTTIRAITLGVSAFCCTATFASTIITAQELFSTSIEYILKPNNPVQIKNTFVTTLRGQCTVYTQDASNDFEIIGLSVEIGHLDDIEFTKGVKVVKTVTDGQTFKLDASPRAAVQITNMGKDKHDVKIKCTSS